MAMANSQDSPYNSAMANSQDCPYTSAMANSSSCSHWWHAPFYIALSLTLAFMALTPLNHARPETPLPSGHVLALNASRALRLRGGFHITAALLQISPDLFFSGPQSTLFAIQDSVFSNLFVPPSEMRRLLRHHATPSALPMAALLKKLPGFCFKTLEQNNLMITKNRAGSVMINGALISHPDIFLGGPIAVHGILGSFDMISFPSCRFSNTSTTFVGKNDTFQAVEWGRIIRLLSSNGFVSFAIGLNAILDGILRDYQNLGSVTILAPPNSGFVYSSSPFLDRIVRLHILPQRFSYIELVSMDSTSLRTLLPGSVLKIDKLLGNLSINGVEITRPDMFSSRNSVVHGISRDFDLGEFFTSFK